MEDLGIISVGDEGNERDNGGSSVSAAKLKANRKNARRSTGVAVGAEGAAQQVQLRKNFRVVWAAMDHLSLGSKRGGEHSTADPLQDRASRDAIDHLSASRPTGYGGRSQGPTAER